MITFFFSYTLLNFLQWPNISYIIRSKSIVKKSQLPVSVMVYYSTMVTRAWNFKLSIHLLYPSPLPSQLSHQYSGFGLENSCIWSPDIYWYLPCFWTVLVLEITIVTKQIKIPFLKEDILRGRDRLLEEWEGESFRQTK